MSTKRRTVSHPETLNLLVRVLASTRDSAELEQILYQVWTAGELRDASQRLEVAAQLLEGYTYESIAGRTGASSATISRVRRALDRGEGTLDRALNRVGRANLSIPRRRWMSSGTDLLD